MCCCFLLWKALRLQSDVISARHCNGRRRHVCIPELLNYGFESSFGSSSVRCDGGHEPAVLRVAGLGDRHPEGGQSDPETGLQLLQHQPPEPGPGGPGAVLGRPGGERAAGGLRGRNREDLQHREGLLHREPALRGPGAGLLHRDGRAERLRAGHLRGERGGAGVEGGPQRARHRAGRREERVQDAAEPGAPEQGRYRREGQRAEDLGPGETGETRVHRQKPAGRLAGSAAAALGPRHGLHPGLRQSGHLHRAPPDPRVRSLVPSAAPRPGGGVRRAPAHRSVPARRRRHGGGGEHPRSDRHAGPEEGRGPRVSEGAGGRRAGAAVSPLPARGGVLRPGPLPPHPRPGGPQAAAQGLPQVQAQLPPARQPGPAGRNGGGGGGGPGGEGGRGGGRGVGEHGAGGGGAEEENTRRGGGGGGGGGGGEEEEEEQEEEKERTGLRGVWGPIRVWDI